MNFSPVDSTPKRDRDKSLTDTIQSVQNFQDFEPEQKCFRCGSTQIHLVRMPNPSTHHAARRCVGCDAFRGWEPKPEAQEKRLQQQTRISQVLKSSLLSQWEHEFLTSLRLKRSLSPKQQETLSQIETKLGAAQ